jgi:hypothetical protein
VRAEAHLVKVQTVRAQTPRTFYLEITPNPDLPVGPLEARIYVDGITREGKIPAVGVVNLRGEVVHDIQFTPPALLFGAGPVGQTGEETVILKSRTGRPFVVDRIKAASEATVVERLLQSPDSEPHFHVRQQFLTPGAQSHKVTFAVRFDGTDERIDIDLPISYYGVRAKLGGSPQ